MLTEKDLLIDIIFYCPIDSIWNISSDSWEKIPQIFSNIISINEVYGWDIAINQSNRKYLIKKIDKNELFDKIVHQDIKFNNDIIFKSYDHMNISFLNNTFPNFNDIMKKYEKLDFLEIL